MPILIEDPHESFRAGELILCDDGICQYHRSKQNPSVVTIYMLLSTRPEVANEMLDTVMSLPGVKIVEAVCPYDAEANRWYIERGFELVKKKRSLNCWERHLDGDVVAPMTVLRALRLGKGWTLEDVTNRTRVDTGTLSLIERRLLSPTRDHLESLSSLFEVAPEDLLRSFGEWARNAKS